MEKSHSINGRKVQIKLFFECLGRSGGYDGNFECPQPLTFETTGDKCKGYKLQFLRESVKVREGFENLLFREYARPHFTDNGLIVECTLTVADKECRAKARSWTDNIKAVVESNLELLKVDHRQVNEEIWDAVLKGVEEIRSDRDRTVLKTFPEERLLRVVGMKTDADQMIRSIDEVIETCGNKFELKTLKITDTRKLETSKLFLLDASSFCRTVNNNDKGLSVRINTQDSLVTFHGLEQDVIKAQRDMYEFLESRLSHPMPNVSEDKRKVLSSSKTRRKLADRFRKAGIEASWETTGGGVEVYGFKDEHIRKAVQILQESVVEKVCDVYPEFVEVLQSPEWMRLQDRLKDEHPGVLAFGLTRDGQFCVTGLDHIVPSVTSEVEKFIRENSVHVEILRFSPSRQKIVCALLDQMQRAAIAEEFKDFRVQIELIDGETKIHVKGTEMGLQQVRGKLEALERQVIVHEQTFTETAKVKFLNKKKYKGDVDIVSRLKNCVLGREREPDGMQVSCDFFFFFLRGGGGGGGR